MAKYKVGDKVKILKSQEPYALVGDILEVNGVAEKHYYMTVERTGFSCNWLASLVDRHTELYTSSTIGPVTKSTPVYAWQWGQERDIQKDFKGSSFYGWDEDWD